MFCLSAPEMFYISPQELILSCPIFEKIDSRRVPVHCHCEFNVGDYVLLYNSRLIFFVGKLLSKWEGPYVIEEVYRSGAIKINNFEGTNPRVVNGQRIKHYISGNPINVETNVIETVTPEEYIRDTFQNVPDSEKA